MTDLTTMKLEKHYTCWIERIWHISNKSPFARADYWPLSVQCPNLTYYSKMLMLVLEAVYQALTGILT